MEVHIMKRACVIIFTVVCLLALVSCKESGTTTNPASTTKIDPKKIIGYSEIFTTCYTIAMPAAMALVEPDVKEKLCKAHGYVKVAWNLYVDSLQIFLENKDAASKDKLVINLNGLNKALSDAMLYFKLDPKYAGYATAFEAALKILTASITTKLEIIDQQTQYDLAYLKLGDLCGVSDEKTVNTPVNEEILQNAIKTVETFGDAPKEITALKK